MPLTLPAVTGVPVRTYRTEKGICTPPEPTVKSMPLALAGVLPSV
ncbi:MAG: hypothetical protein QOJ04_285, partial [Caballeronia sp.]|nr:hypothetical protein [Caballeronia sp.]